MMSSQTSILSSNGHKSIEILFQNDSTDNLVNFNRCITEEFSGVIQRSLTIEIQIFEASKSLLQISLSDIKNECFIVTSSSRHSVFHWKILSREISSVRKGMSVDNPH